LDAAKIDRMVERYRQNSIASRAVTISRTESVKVLSEAQEQAFRQTITQAQISPDDVEQTWHTNMDGRERLTHGLMNGQVRPFGVAFDSSSGAKLMYPGDSSAPAAEVIMCRCRRSFRVKIGERSAEAA
jgi:hypothetical protein